MFEKILTDPAGLLRHRSAAFSDERERYLQHCADFGAAPASLRSKSAGLLFLATHLGPNASAGVDLGRLQQIAKERQSTSTGFTPPRHALCKACRKFVAVVDRQERQSTHDPAHDGRAFAQGRRRHQHHPGVVRARVLGHDKHLRRGRYGDEGKSSGQRRYLG